MQFQGINGLSPILCGNKPSPGPNGRQIRKIFPWPLAAAIKPGRAIPDRRQDIRQTFELKFQGDLFYPFAARASRSSHFLDFPQPLADNPPDEPPFESIDGHAIGIASSDPSEQSIPVRGCHQSMQTVVLFLYG